jgi:hypothetical protein
LFELPHLLSERNKAGYGAGQGTLQPILITRLSASL